MILQKNGSGQEQTNQDSAEQHQTPAHQGELNTATKPRLPQRSVDRSSTATSFRRQQIEALITTYQVLYF